MAFGLFKKTKKADIIIYNGIIMTQNPDLPAAEAAAIRDGLIIAVGAVSYTHLTLPTKRIV